MVKEKIGAILDSYKNGTMDKAEAESTIERLFTPDKLTWPDDGTVRIVAFIGTKLFDTQIPEDKKVEIVYTGKARNVISFTNITCSIIEGNARAGTAITCDAIEGNVEAGTAITCDTIGGNAQAGNEITCDAIEGNAYAGNVINCDVIEGNAHAGNVINSDVINGNAEAPRYC